MGVCTLLSEQGEWKIDAAEGPLGGYGAVGWPWPLHPLPEHCPQKISKRLFARGSIMFWDGLLGDSAHLKRRQEMWRRG